MKKLSVSASARSINIVYRDTGSFRITSELIEKMLKEAKQVKKKALLTIVIPRNNTQNFVINCDINIENK